MEKFIPQEFKNTSLADKLTQLLKNKGVEFKTTTIEEQQETKKNLEQRESAIADTELAELLKEYGVQVEIKKLPEGFYEIPVVFHFTETEEEKLPEGYAYKGGAARALLFRSLGIDSFAQPRDLDIVRTIEQEPYPNADDELAQKFMPHDFTYGARAETCLDLDEYFKTRDLTLNEVIATDSTIHTTKQCILDTLRRIIRPTDYELTKEDYLNDKMLSKILAFYAENIERYDAGEIAEEAEYQFENYFIDPFWLALQLDRAFEKGAAVAEKFFQELKKRNQVPANITDAIQCATYLLNTMKGGNFYYRHAPIKQFDLENNLAEKYESLPKSSGMSKGV